MASLLHYQIPKHHLYKIIQHIISAINYIATDFLLATQCPEQAISISLVIKHRPELIRLLQQMAETGCTSLMKQNAVITSTINGPSLTPLQIATTVCEGINVSATYREQVAVVEETIVDHVEYRRLGSADPNWYSYVAEISLLPKLPV
jgi:hypothetical protein